MRRKNNNNNKNWSRFVEGMKTQTYFIKRARVLSSHIQFTAKRTECPPVDAMSMRCADYIRSRSVHRSMDHIRCSVQQPNFAAINDFPLMVNLQ